MSVSRHGLFDLVSPEALADARARALDSHSIVSISDTTGRITFANEHFCQTMGYGLDELVGQSYNIINSGVHEPGFFQSLWDTLNTGQSWVGEVCNRNRDGHLLWFDNIVVPLFDTDGTVTGHFSVRKNITKRKEADRQLKRRESFLQDVSKLAKIGGWNIDLREGTLYWSDETKRIHEVPPDYVPALEKAIEFYAPEARSAITHAVESAMDTGEPWDLELPLITAKGRSIWVRAIGNAVHEDGKATSIVGSFQDITERKMTEDVLRGEITQRHTAEQLLRDVLETLPDAVAAYDEDDRLIVCNSAYLETYAISADAIVPGASFESILRCGLARGQYEGVGTDPAAQEAWLAERLQHHREPPEHLTQRLLDGTWLQVREHRSPTGTTVGVRSDITSLKRAENELRKLAETDQLTGLLNRRSFCQRLDTVIEAQADTGTAGGCVALFDIDHFKPINDAYGHDVGDEVLSEIGARLQAVLGPDDFAARLGGDEFVLLLAPRAAQSDYEIIIENLFAGVDAPIETKAASVRAGISLGVAAIEDSKAPSRLLLKFADLAQYRAKQDGRGQWRWFSRADAAALQREGIVARQLEASIRQGRDLTYALLPIASAQTGEPLGFSSEVCWTFQGEAFGASKLFELAQKHGQIAELCSRALNAALEATGQAHAMGAQSGHLWITASADHVRLEPFVDTLEAARTAHGIEAQSITLAVEEAALVDRSAAAIERTFQTLSALGYRIAVDDFGQSATSLGTLQRLGVHAVRLHRSLTDPLVEETADPTLVRGLVAMADALDMDVIGFNVTKPAQAARLAQLGCDAFQGPLIGAPVTTDAFQSYLMEQARRQLAGMLDSAPTAPKKPASDVA